MGSLIVSAALLNSSRVRGRSRDPEKEHYYLTNGNAGCGPSEEPGGRSRKRKEQRSPDRRASLARKHRLGGKSTMMPTHLCDEFTEGERAALCTIAHVVERSGHCDWPLDKVAAIAGVSRRTVQYALEEAKRLKLIAVQYRRQRLAKNLTNVITITCRKWLAHLRPAAKQALAVLMAIGCKNVHSTSQSINRSAAVPPWQALKRGLGEGKRGEIEPIERSQGAYERERAGPLRPPGERGRT